MSIESLMAMVGASAARAPRMNSLMNSFMLDIPRYGSCMSPGCDLPRGVKQTFGTEMSDEPLAPVLLGDEIHFESRANQLGAAVLIAGRLQHDPAPLRMRRVVAHVKRLRGQEVRVDLELRRWRQMA